jgi:hypothetical protein
MRAGHLDRLVTIQRKTESITDEGGVTENWSTLLLRRPASYRALRGDEVLGGDQRVGREQVEFRFWWSADIAGLSVNDRLIYPALQADSPAPDAESGRLFDILAVHEVGRREGVLVTAARRADVA